MLDKLKIFKLILLILGIICFLINLFFLIFYRHYRSSEAVEILFYISFGLSYLTYLLMLFMDLPIKNKAIKKFRKKCSSSCGIVTIAIIFFIIYFFEIVILSLMIDYDMNTYWINCPFTIADNYNKHYKRRCELYSINNNSRFANQYICSYNPYEDFEYEYHTRGKHTYRVPKKLKKKIKSDFVRCVKVNNLIPDSKVITLFNNEYKNTDKYYCSRTNIPKKNSLIDDKDCNNKTKHIFIYILYGFYFLKVFLYIAFIFYLKGIKSYSDYYANAYNRNYNNANYNNGNNNNNINNDYNRNNSNNEFNSTKGSEDVNKNNNNSSFDFIHQETKNIIIDNKEENKEEIPFKDNTRDYPYDNDNNNEKDMNNNNLDISKKSSSTIKNNEVQNQSQNDKKDADDENSKQSQGGNAYPEDGNI